LFCFRESAAHYHQQKYTKKKGLIYLLPARYAKSRYGLIRLWWTINIEPFPRSAISAAKTSITHPGSGCPMINYFIQPQ
jgi:hypothetical protein